LKRPRTIFFGSPSFAVPALQRLAAVAEVVAVVSQPDRPAGRGQALSEPEVIRAARQLDGNLQILQPVKVRTPELEAQLRTLQADLFVVVAYGRILPQSLLDLPRLGAWNVHASLLPKLRGAAPIQWSIINGDAESGVAIMRLEAGLDTGPVAACAATPIRDDDTAGTLSARLAVQGAELLIDVLPRIVDGSVPLARQDHDRATLAPILRKEDGHLDFTQPARRVSARARGVDPWPGATASLEGQAVKLFSPRLATEVGGGEPPGIVLGMDAAGLRIACGERTVIIFDEVQIPGRKRLPAAAAAAGRAIVPGACFA
jgi:methionyl-tRNA formyltransferase